MAGYVNVNNETKKIVEGYVNIGGATRKIIKGYANFGSGVQHIVFETPVQYVHINVSIKDKSHGMNKQGYDVRLWKKGQTSSQAFQVTEYEFSTDEYTHGDHLYCEANFGNTYLALKGENRLN